MAIQRDVGLRDVRTAIDSLAGIPDRTFETLQGQQLDELRRCIAIARGCAPLPFDNLLNHHVERLAAQTEGAIRFAGRVRKFADRQMTTEESRLFTTEWFREFAEANSFGILLADTVPYLIVADPKAQGVKGLAEAIIQEQKAALHGMARDVGITQEQANVSLRDLRLGLDELRQYTKNIASIEAAAGAQANNTYFDKEAKTHEAASKLWLRWAVILMVAGVAAAFVFVRFLPVTGQWSEVKIVESVVTRIITLAAIFGGAAWCGSIYRARAHLASLNSHRAVAVQTLQLFIASTLDSDVRDAIILAASRLVYSDSTSGLLGSGAQMSSKLAEKVAESAASKL